MSARRATPPAWPRALSADLAASYVSLGQSTWLREVKQGRAPAPVQITPGRRVWLREDLDAWLDRRSARDAASPESNPWLT